MVVRVAEGGHHVALGEVDDAVDAQPAGARRRRRPPTSACRRTKRVPSNHRPLRPGDGIGARQGRQQQQAGGGRGALHGALGACQRHFAPAQCASRLGAAFVTQKMRVTIPQLQEKRARRREARDAHLLRRELRRAVRRRRRGHPADRRLARHGDPGPRLDAAGDPGANRVPRALRRARRARGRWSSPTCPSAASRNRRSRRFANAARADGRRRPDGEARGRRRDGRDHALPRRARRAGVRAHRPHAAIGAHASAATGAGQDRRRRRPAGRRCASRSRPRARPSC